MEILFGFWFSFGAKNHSCKNVMGEGCDQNFFCTCLFVNIAYLYNKEVEKAWRVEKHCRILVWKFGEKKLENRSFNFLLEGNAMNVHWSIRFRD